MALRRSPKPGALTATDVKVPRMLLTTKAARASPSTSSAMMTSGLPACMTFSRIGSRSTRFEILFSTISRYGSARAAGMPSVSSSSRPKVLLSSTVMTPSLPTLSIASAMISPTVVSAAEIDAVAAICSLVSTSRAWLPSASVTAATACSMPRLSAIGFAPAATLRSPCRTRAWARTVAVVVPSPATSSVFFATSLTSSAPSFWYGSSSSISLAMLTPSLVMVGAPHFVPRTTLRPFGPSVTFTVSARTFMPRSRPRRASSPKAINLAICVILYIAVPTYRTCSDRPAMTAATVPLSGVPSHSVSTHIGRVLTTVQHLLRQSASDSPVTPSRRPGSPLASPCPAGRHGRARRHWTTTPPSPRPGSARTREHSRLRRHRCPADMARLVPAPGTAGLARRRHERTKSRSRHHDLAFRVCTAKRSRARVLRRNAPVPSRWQATPGRTGSSETTTRGHLRTNGGLIAIGDSSDNRHLRRSRRAAGGHACDEPGADVLPLLFRLSPEHDRPTRGPWPVVAAGLTLRLCGAGCAPARLLDRAAYETLYEDGDEGANPGGVELAVEAAYPTLKVGLGDLFARETPLKSPGDLGDLLGVARRGLH